MLLYFSHRLYSFSMASPSSQNLAIFWMSASPLPQKQNLSSLKYSRLSSQCDLISSNFYRTKLLGMNFSITLLKSQQSLLVSAEMSQLMSLRPSMITSQFQQFITIDTSPSQSWKPVSSCLAISQPSLFLRSEIESLIFQKLSSMLFGFSFSLSSSISRNSSLASIAFRFYCVSKR